MTCTFVIRGFDSKVMQIIITIITRQFSFFHHVTCQSVFALAPMPLKDPDDQNTKIHQINFFHLSLLHNTFYS